jgi:Arc/MetJ-type ribon-helix-helix transcriptional regulator
MTDRSLEEGKLSGDGTRFSFRIPEEMFDRLDVLVDDGVFASRSEAGRSALRDLFDEYDADERLQDEKRIREGHGGDS